MILIIITSLDCALKVPSTPSKLPVRIDKDVEIEL